MEREAKGGKKIFSNHMSEKEQCLENIKNSYNSTVKNETIQMENGQKIRRETLSMRIYRWQISTRGVNNH